MDVVNIFQNTRPSIETKMVSSNLIGQPLHFSVYDIINFRFTAGRKDTRKGEKELNPLLLDRHISMGRS